MRRLIISKMTREQEKPPSFYVVFCFGVFLFFFDVVRLRVELRVLFLKLARSKIVFSKILR